jgi:UDP-N-acetylmuramate--alanine ligase
MSNNHNNLDISTKLLALSPIHFLGIGGSGMAPLAELSASWGAKISGSDLVPPSWLHSKLFFKQGESGEESAIRTANTVVFSSAISKDNVALTLSQKLGKTLMHRSDLLALFSNNSRTVAVAGTHGKTTTSALVSHVLSQLDQNPSWIIGAAFADGGAAFGRGDSDLLVIEADESDGSFVKYQPYISVVNNIAPDHMDFYLNEENLRATFGKFVAQTKPEGSIVFNADDTTAALLASQSGRKHFGFGMGPSADVRLLHARSSGLSTTGEVALEGKSFAFRLPLPGLHNAFNAVAAITTCYAMGLDHQSCAAALNNFPGVSRRLQRYKTKTGALIFDDYAHNPGKIGSCLSGLSAAFPDKRILAVFQPHRFSRISSLYDQFVTSFRAPRVRVVVLPVYASGEPHSPGFPPDRIARDIALGSGVETFPANSLKAAGDLVKLLMDPDLDVLVTIGAGDVWRVAKDVSSHL